MATFINDKCPPPSNWKKTNEWVNKALPSEKDYKGPPRPFNFVPIVPLPLLENLLELAPLLAANSPEPSPDVTSTITYGNVVSSPAVINIASGNIDNSYNIPSLVWYGVGGGGRVAASDAGEDID